MNARRVFDVKENGEIVRIVFRHPAFSGWIIRWPSKTKKLRVERLGEDYGVFKTAESAIEALVAAYPHRVFTVTERI